MSPTCGYLPGVWETFFTLYPAVYGNSYAVIYFLAGAQGMCKISTRLVYGNRKCTYN